MIEDSNPVPEAEVNPASESEVTSTPTEVTPEAQVEETAPQPITEEELERRINGAAAEARRSAKKEVMRLRQELEVLRGQRTETPNEEVERLAQQRAEQIASVKVFNDQCDRIATDGEKAFGKGFGEAMEDFNDVIAFGSQAWVETIQAALETGDAHKILHHLGQHPDEAEKLANLDPIRRATHIAKIAAKLNQPKPTSKAPPPIKSITSTVRSGSAEPEIGTPEWFKAEDKRDFERRRGRA